MVFSERLAQAECQKDGKQMYNANAQQHANNDFAMGDNPVGEYFIAALKAIKWNILKLKKKI